MRTALFLIAVMIVFAASPLWAADFQPIPTGATVDQLLDALKLRGDTLKDFSADVTLTDVDQDTADSHADAGKVVFQNLGDGNGRIRITFTQHIEGNRIYPEQHEYTLADGWVTDRDYVKKHQDRRQIAQSGAKIGILKLGGPIPLPIGQDKDDVLREFDVTLAAAAKDDPPHSIHATLKPKPQTDLAAKFAQIDIWVDQQSGMPLRIVTLDSTHEHLQTTDFANMRLNTGLVDADFSLSPVDPKEWDMVEEPFKP